MPEKEGVEAQKETKNDVVIPPPPTETPVLRLTQRELEDCREIINEIQRLCNLNVSLDIEKNQVLNEIVNRQGEQKRINDKVKRRLGLPANSEFQVDINSGIITPMGARG